MSDHASPEFFQATERYVNPPTCDMCDHPSHHDTDCGEVVGYDHLNGDHECGCPGSLNSLLAQAWDEGYAARKSEDAHSPGETNPYS